jgi:hypothetical protein
MSSKKKIAAVAVTAVALSIGTVGVSTANAAKATKSVVKSANAGTTTTGVPNPMAGGTAAGKDGHGPRGGGLGPVKVLADLVTKGTITQADSDAIAAAHKAFEDAEHAPGATPTAGGPEADFKTVLTSLVGKNGFTQAKADAVLAAFVAAKPAGLENGMGPKGNPADQAAHDADRVAEEALVASTIGVDAATIKTRLAAGESLATIAGAKKDALIAALVAFETKEIDARVTAGTLTAAQATTLKANLTAHVTDAVNKVRGPGMGPKGDAGKGGKGHKGPRP